MYRAPRITISNISDARIFRKSIFDFQCIDIEIEELIIDESKGKNRESILFLVFLLCCSMHLCITVVRAQNYHIGNLFANLLQDKIVSKLIELHGLAVHSIFKVTDTCVVNDCFIIIPKKSMCLCILEFYAYCINILLGISKISSWYPG